MYSDFLEQKNSKLAKQWSEHSNSKISEISSFTKRNDQPKHIPM